MSVTVNTYIPPAKSWQTTKDKQKTNCQRFSSSASSKRNELKKIFFEPGTDQLFLDTLSYLVSLLHVRIFQPLHELQLRGKNNVEYRIYRIHRITGRLFKISFSSQKLILSLFYQVHRFNIVQNDVTLLIFKSRPKLYGPSFTKTHCPQYSNTFS